MLLEGAKVSDSFSREIRFGDCPSSSGNGLWGLGRGAGGALLGQGNNVEYRYQRSLVFFTLGMFLSMFYVLFNHSSDDLLRS